MQKSLLMLVFLVALAAPAHAALRHVIVIVMENKDAFETGGNSGDYIYGNTIEAPYINGTLRSQAARANNFIDELGEDPSQPHYILMEAGRHEFDDVHFTCNNDPNESCSNSSWQRNWTESPAHLTAQIEVARNPALTWMTYQEGIDPSATGACPVRSAGLYAAKHNPFVYFADVAGSPPDAGNAYCIAHTRDFSRFAPDMQSGSLANYVFITPNLCNDMHGRRQCRENVVAIGDGFLQTQLPAILTWAQENEAVVFVVWDEGKAEKTIPFFAAGWGIKANYESNVQYSHRSVLRTIERIFGLPVLDAVKDVSDLSDMFEPGILPARQ